MAGSGQTMKLCCWCCIGGVR